MPIASDFKFGLLAHMDNPHMAPEIFFRKMGIWRGLRDSVNFWALNDNSSRMAQDTNFKS